MKKTLKEASSELGISVKALRYRIKANGIEPEMEDGVHGKRYVLSDQQIAALGTLPSASDEDVLRDYSSTSQDRPQESREAQDTEVPPRRKETPEEPEDAQYRFQESPQEPPRGGSSWIPVDVYRDTQEALREALALSRESREDRLEAERKAEEARENAMRMAYRLQELSHELNSQKNLLSENADSLVEKQAELRELEVFKAQERAKIEELRRDREAMERKLREAEEAAQKSAEEAREREERLKAMEAELKARQERDARPFWKRVFG